MKIFGFLPLFLSLLLFGSCGTVTQTGGENAGLEVEITELPDACFPNRKDALRVSMTVETGHSTLGPFGASQDGNSIKKTFKKNSVTGGDPFEEIHPCQPLKFCITIQGISDACAAVLSKKLGRDVGKGSVLCTGWINPKPCGEWNFEYTDLH